MLKKKIILLFVSAIVLFVGCVGYILAVGNTYFVQLRYADTKIENVKVKLDEKDIVKYRINDDQVSFEGLNRGDTYVTIDYSVVSNKDSLPNELIFNLHTTRFGTVVNTSNFDFNGYLSVIISAFVYLLIVFGVVCQSTKASFKENWYSYKNITYVGLIIFIVLIMITFAINSRIYFTANGFGLMNFVGDLMSAGNFVVLMLLPLLSIIFLLISVSNVALLFREGKSLKNILGVILGIVFILGAFAGSIFDIIYNNNSSSGTLYATLFLNGFVSYIVVYFDCIFLGACICSLMASFRKPKYDRDYILILGCGLRKDGTLLPLLKGRVDAAINFVNKQKEVAKKNCIFVPSGGQGDDEIIAEGDAMQNYLLEQGVDEQNIMVENKSTTTLENMMFSKKLIDEKNKNAKVAFATTRYHLFRSGMYATTAGLNVIGVGSKTRWYFWPNAFLREFVGVICAKIKYHIVTAIVLFIVNLLLISGGYLLLFF